MYAITCLHIKNFTESNFLTANKTKTGIWTCSKIVFIICTLHQTLESSMDEHLAWMGDIRNVYKNLDRKPEGKQPLGRQWWEDNIKRDRKRNWVGGYSLN